MLVCGFCISIPLFVIGIPQLHSTDFISNEELGRHSTLEDFSILRLLYAYDAEQAAGRVLVRGLSIEGRLIILALFALVTPAVFLFTTKAELRKALNNIRSFEKSPEGGFGCEIGFLRVDAKAEESQEKGKQRDRTESTFSRTSTATSLNLVGLGESRLRAAFEHCGLGPGPNAAQQDPNAEIWVESIQTIPDVKHLNDLKELRAERQNVLDTLEEAEVIYVSCFRAATPSKMDNSVISPTATTGATPVLPFGPSGHYHLTQNNIAGVGDKLISPTVVESIGKEIPGSSSFQEVGLSHRPGKPEFQIGQHVRRKSGDQWTTVSGTTQRASIVSAAPSSALSPVSDQPSFEDSHFDESPITDKTAASDEEGDTAEFYALHGISQLDGQKILMADPLQYPQSEAEAQMWQQYYYMIASQHFNTSASGLTSTGLPIVEYPPPGSYGTRRLSTVTELDDEATNASEKAMSVNSAMSPISPVTPGSHMKPGNLFKFPSMSKRSRAASSPRTSLGEIAEDEVISRFPDVPRWPHELEEQYLSSQTVAMPDENSIATSPITRRRRWSVSSSGSLTAQFYGRTRERLSSIKSLKPPITNNAMNYGPRLCLASIATSFEELGRYYQMVRSARSRLRRINADIKEKQEAIRRELRSPNASLAGYFLVGRNVSQIPGVELIQGRYSEDINFELFGKQNRWIFPLLLVAVPTLVLLAAICIPALLSILWVPGVHNTWKFSSGILQKGTTTVGAISGLASPVMFCVLFFLAIQLVSMYFEVTPLSVVQGKSKAFIAVGVLSVYVVPVLMVSFSAFASASHSFSTKAHIGRRLADGIIHGAVLPFTSVVIFSALILAAILVRPFHLFIKYRSLRDSRTPRQRFNALKPLPGFSAFQTGGLFLIFALTGSFYLIYPLIAIPAFFTFPLATLLFRHQGRYLHSLSNDTHGKFSVYSFRIILFLIVIEPLLLGLLTLSRELYIPSGICMGGSALLLSLAFGCFWTGRKQLSLSEKTMAQLALFELGASIPSTETSSRNNSNAMPSLPVGLDSTQVVSLFGLPGVDADISNNPSLPLPSRSIDPNLQPLLANECHPDRPVEKLEIRLLSTPIPETRGLIPLMDETRPMIWLPDDDIAREEGQEMERYWGFQSVSRGGVTLDKLVGLDRIFEK